MTQRRGVLAGAGILLALLIGAFAGFRLGRHWEATRPSSEPPSVAVAEGECLDIREADEHVGESRCVAGRVVRVFTSRGGHVFIDFCPDYRDCPFGSVVFASDRSKFGDLTTLQGRRVELRGTLTRYRGRAEIVLRDAEQIRVSQ